MRCCTFLFTILFVSQSTFFWFISPAVADALPPKLVVVVVVDQLRPDRLDAGLPGGLGLLLREGRVYNNARLDHGVTNTCPGHGVVLTGMNPVGIGILGNQGFNRDEWRVTYCVEDLTVKTLTGGEGRSPRAMQVDALGDWMKRVDADTRVVSVSIKDRAAIMLGGQSPDAAVWFDRDAGMMTSSTYYTAEHPLPQSVVQFNGSDPLLDGYLSRLPEQWVHPAGTFRDDQFTGEADKFSGTSPHPLRQGDLQAVAEQFYVSPYSDEAVIDLAVSLAAEYELGQRGSVDLLAISLSATDTVGHAYGPFSAESENTLNRIDTKLTALFTHLDQSVGEGEWLVVLTADHGVAPLPEYVQQQGEGADFSCVGPDSRRSLASLLFTFYGSVYFEFLLPFGNPMELISLSGPQLYINERYAADYGTDVAEVAQFLEQSLEAEPYIEQVWTPSELLNGDSEFARLYRNSWSEELGGDLLIQNAPGCVVGMEEGTTHGTPFDYDRRVPLVFFGPGVVGGVQEGAAASVDIAPTLARLLGISPAQKLDGRVLNLTGPE